jgi:hypothetical protein
MAAKPDQAIFGVDRSIVKAARMTTAQRLRWLEAAREFTLKMTPKSALRAYLKIKG